MNSKRKMDVVVTKTAFGKDWVLVTLKHSNKFIPSFEDLFRIVQAIAYCEDKKYPQGKGRKLLAEFLNDCVFEKDFSSLAKKYKLPIRDGFEIIDSNGAKVNKP